MSHHTHVHHDPDEAPTPSEFWEEFYAGDHPWSGKANERLVEEIAARPLTTGTVLDLGCGSGGDVLWLAGMGWKATGADISRSALDRAAHAAAQAGLTDQVDWVQADLDTDFPQGSWDLVTASYLHSPVALARTRVLHHAEDALNPGGTLIVVSHQKPPAWRGEHPAPLPGLDEVVASVTRPGFTVVHAEDVETEVFSPEGEPGTKVDTVVRVVRDS